MNDLSTKTIKCNDTSYYVYCELKYDTELYILTFDLKEEIIKNGIKIFKLINKDNNYYLDSNINKNVISKFVVFLSL